MTSGQIVGKMDIQKQLNVPLEGRELRGGHVVAQARERAHGDGGAPRDVVQHTQALGADRALAEEARNIQFCPLQEKFHTFVLRGLRNISEAP